MNPKHLDVSIDTSKITVNIGDAVTFKDYQCIVLSKFTDDLGIIRYHVFSPGLGVYTAFRDEIKYICHSSEYDNLIDMLSNKAYLKIA